MLIHELLIREVRKKTAPQVPEGPRDHVILHYGFALEPPYLYSREAALTKAGPKDLVMSIGSALEKYGKDPYLGPDLYKISLLVKNNY